MENTSSSPPAETHGVMTLFDPLKLLLLSASFIPTTIFRLCKSWQFSKLTTWDTFQDAWFGTFWAWFGPRSREMGEPLVRPLLKQAEGIVIDIGPGSGEWLHLFADNKDVTRIFGVEPNHEHHPALRRRVQELGLQHVYEILGVGAEDLATCGIDKGSVDTICTIQCLCSVPDPENIIKDLYPYLKPGGKWLVYEHVKTKFQNDVVGVWQKYINYIWPIFFGGCDITRPTDDWLLQAGEWEHVSLKPAPGEWKYDAIPHAVGWLIKKK